MNIGKYLYTSLIRWQDSSHHQRYSPAATKVHAVLSDQSGRDKIVVHSTRHLDLLLQAFGKRIEIIEQDDVTLCFRGSSCRSQMRVLRVRKNPWVTPPPSGLRCITADAQPYFCESAPAALLAVYSDSWKGPFTGSKRSTRLKDKGGLTREDRPTIFLSSSRTLSALAAEQFHKLAKAIPCYEWGLPALYKDDMYILSRDGSDDRKALNVFMDEVELNSIGHHNHKDRTPIGSTEAPCYKSTTHHLPNGSILVLADHSLTASILIGANEKPQASTVPLSPFELAVRLLLRHQVNRPPITVPACNWDEERSVMECCMHLWVSAVTTCPVFGNGGRYAHLSHIFKEAMCQILLILLPRCRQISYSPNEESRKLRLLRGIFLDLAILLDIEVRAVVPD